VLVTPSGNNQLSSLPENISNLTSLNCLNLDCNQLTRLPESIDNLMNLKSLKLADNPLIDLSNLKGLSHSLAVLQCKLDIYLLNKPM
jgi:Leucine-rich repeat (LRR) protein